MALRNLIDGQTIKIDNHNRGGEFEWGKGVHMHKRMNKDKYSGAEVLIYLDEDKDLEFSSIRGGAEVQNRIKNEIRRAFKKASVRTKFIRSFYKSLQNVLDASNINDSNERNKLVEQAALRIIRLFSLNDEIQEHFIKEANDIFLFSQDEGMTPAVLAINANTKSIALGFNQNIVTEMTK